MKLLLALVLLCALAPAGARTPFQARCEETVGRSVSVLVAQQNGYRIDNTRSYQALTWMKGMASPGAYVLGLTHTESRVKIGVGGRVLTDPQTGYECVAPRIEVSLFLRPDRHLRGARIPSELVCVSGNTCA